MQTISVSSAIPSKRDTRLTNTIRRRYQRIAPFYDLMEGMAERRYHPWREKLWALLTGSQVLEVGVGTGKNMPFYPTGITITAIDLTPGMLQRARKRAAELNIGPPVDLQLGDVQELDFRDATFDSAVAAFVFCSVPVPVLGLRELRRVVRPGGRVLLLEHMRSPDPFFGALMDFLNPLVVRMMGANINRNTLDNILQAGLEIERLEDLEAGGIFKLIMARVPDR